METNELLAKEKMHVHPGEVQHRRILRDRFDGAVDPVERQTGGKARVNPPELVVKLQHDRPGRDEADPKGTFGYDARGGSNLGLEK